MNWAQFVASRDALYSGGMAWWIEHDCPQMRGGFTHPAGTVRATHYGQTESMQTKVLNVSSREESFDLQDYAQKLQIDANCLTKILYRLTRLGHLIRYGQPGDYRYRRA